MGRVCREMQDWVETNIERPIETWENQQQTTCANEPCNWWMLCLNVLVCWLVWVLVKVVRIVVVTVGKWVARVVCEIVNFVLDVVGYIINLILSIPIIGGIIRTILNCVTEVIWRIASLPDFFGSLGGITPRKKMYLLVSAAGKKSKQPMPNKSNPKIIPDLKPYFLITNPAGKAIKK